MCCWVTKTVWKNILRLLEGSGKVMEFRMSNIVGILRCSYSCCHPTVFRPCIALKGLNAFS